MAYYRVCPYCKSNLDPGERCDCIDRRKKHEEYLQNITKIETRTGQLSLDFKGMVGDATKRRLA